MPTTHPNYWFFPYPDDTAPSIQHNVSCQAKTSVIRNGGRKAPVVGDIVEEESPEKNARANDEGKGFDEALPGSKCVEGDAHSNYDLQRPAEGNGLTIRKQSGTTGSHEQIV